VQNPDAEALARVRTTQRSKLEHVPVWVLTGAQSSPLPEPVPDRAAEFARRTELEALLQQESVQTVMADLESGDDFVIASAVRKQLEHLARVAALADRHAGDGYLDPRVEAWLRPKGLGPKH
jgi:L-fucose isomerase-like protein